MPLACAEDADRIRAWYRWRGRIEDWHRVSKTGGRAEYLGHRTGERLTRALTIPAVIAWRLRLMVLLGREVPAQTPLVLFTPLEVQVRRDLARYRGWALPATLGAMVLVLARLGSYLAHNHDPPPGPPSPSARMPTRPWQAANAYRPTDLRVMSRARGLAGPRSGACCGAWCCRCLPSCPGS